MCGGGERTSSFFRTQDHVDGELPNGNILKHVQTAITLDFKRMSSPKPPTKIDCIRVRSWTEEQARSNDPNH